MDQNIGLGIEFFFVCMSDLTIGLLDIFEFFKILVKYGNPHDHFKEKL
jgi:hypothetical protein